MSQFYNVVSSGYNELYLQITKFKKITQTYTNAL